MYQCIRCLFFLNALLVLEVLQLFCNAGFVLFFIQETRWLAWRSSTEGPALWTHSKLVPRGLGTGSERRGGWEGIVWGTNYYTAVNVTKF